MKNKMIRITGALVMAAFLTCTTGACFGKFELTRKIYRFNRTVSTDKWIRWCVFLVLAIVPIYGIGLLVDVLFANSVEFWSGSNPVAGTTKSIAGPDGSIARATRLADGAVLLEIADAKGAAFTYTLRVTDRGMSAYDASGRLVASVFDDKEKMQLLLH